MIKGFKEFILRGNVIELAVAVIIGTAFTAIVEAVTNNLVNPIIASFGSTEVDGFGFRLREGMASTFIDFGAVITAVINFVIVAAVVYFVIITPMNKLASLRKRGEEPEPEAPSEEIILLQEIRDLLAARREG